jgi:hypothetical protein
VDGVEADVPRRQIVDLRDGFEVEDDPDNKATIIRNTSTGGDGGGGGYDTITPVGSAGVTPVYASGTAIMARMIMGAGAAVVSTTPTGGIQVAVSAITGTGAAGSGYRVDAGYSGSAETGYTALFRGLNTANSHLTIGYSGVDDSIVLTVNTSAQNDGGGVAVWNGMNDYAFKFRTFAATSPLAVAVNPGNSDQILFTLGTVPYTKGGTGLTALGTAFQVLRTNAGATAIEWATVAGADSAAGTGAAQQYNGSGGFQASSTNAFLKGTTSSSLNVNGADIVYAYATGVSFGGSAYAYANTLSNVSTFVAYASVQTTDATPTTVYSWTILGGGGLYLAHMVEGRLCAISSTGGASGAWVRRRRFKSASGTVTAGTQQAEWTDDADGMSSAAYDIDNSGSTGRHRFTGLAATTIRSFVKHESQLVLA